MGKRDNNSRGGSRGRGRSQDSHRGGGINKRGSSQNRDRNGSERRGGFNNRDRNGGSARGGKFSRDRQNGDRPNGNRNGDRNGNRNDSRNGDRNNRGVRSQSQNNQEQRGRPRTKQDRLARQNRGSSNQHQNNNNNNTEQNRGPKRNTNKFNKNDRKPQRYPQSQPQQQQQQQPIQKQQQQGINLKLQKKKGKVPSQYSEYVGKSMFKIIPEGNNNQQQEDEEQYQVEMEEDPNQQFQGDMQDQGEGEYEGEEEEDGDYDEIDDDEEDDEVDGQEGEEGDEIEGDLQEQDDEEQQEQGDEQQQQNEQQFEYEPESDEQPQQKQGQQQQQGQQQIDDQQQDMNVDISVINLRIQQTIQVLMNVGKLGQGKSRKHFVDKLKTYVHRYYGYNFQLIDHFLNFMNPAEMVQFFEANQTQRPLTIRTNTLKTRRKQLAQALIQRGVNLDPLAEWSKVGIKIYDTKVPIGATPEYLAGHYMLQSGSSFLPVLAMDPQMGQKILDMASAPGGKTSYIAQVMKNSGSIFANDLKKDRLKALQFNLFRLGITNTIVTCRDGRKYPAIFPNTFDRVLLDAPCTGLGIISKDHSIKANRSLLDIYKNSHVQKQLILAAIDCCKVGGVIVYSTCSVSPLENQQVINYALKKRYVKIVDIDDLVEVGTEGLIKFIDKRYHVDLKKTKRIYPHVHNMDGFYLGKLVKMANGKKETSSKVQEQQQE